MISHILLECLVSLQDNVIRINPLRIITLGLTGTNIWCQIFIFRWSNIFFNPVKWYGPKSCHRWKICQRFSFRRWKALSMAASSSLRNCCCRNSYYCKSHCRAGSVWRWLSAWEYRNQSRLWSISFKCDWSNNNQSSLWSRNWSWWKWWNLHGPV